MKIFCLALCGVSLSLISSIVYAESTNKAKEGSKNITLQRLTVSADFTEKPDLQTVQSVSIIDQQDIQGRQSNSAVELVVDLPGVEAYGGPNRQGAEFNIRGLNRPEQNIVRVDGVIHFFEQYRLGSFFSDPELFKQMDVVRGPVSTLYGNGAIGGVVNIVTKDASDFLKPDQTYGVKLKTGYHTNNSEWKNSVYLYARPEENLDVLFNISFRNSGDYKFANGEKFTGSGVDTQSVLFKTAYQFLNDHSVSVSYTHLDDDNIAEYRQNDRGNGGLDNGFSEGLVKRNLKNHTVSLAYAYQPDTSLVDFEARLGYSNIHNKETGLNPADYSLASRSLPEGQTRQAKYKNWQVSLINKSRFKTSDQVSHTLIYGLDYNFRDRFGSDYSTRTQQSGPTVSHPSGKQTVYGVFIQDEINIYNRLILTPALRYTKYHTKGKRDGWESLPESWFADANIYSAFSPSFAAEIKILPELSVVGGYYQGFRAPVIDEIYAHSFFYPNKTTSLKLKEEKARTYEGGLKTNWKNIFLNRDKLQAKLIYFTNQISDKIESKRSDQATNLSYVNAGKSQIKGWEFEGAYYKSAHYLRLAASRLRGKSTSDSGQKSNIDTIPADKIAMSMGGVIKKWNLDLGIRSLFSFKIPASRREVICSHRGCTTPEAVPGYTTHSFYMIWSPEFLSGLKAQMTISNLFDEDYSRHNSSVRSFGRDFRFLLSYQY